ncbi:pyridoxamine 5'-phosphate oxidase family protein [Microlunatus endophyticus]|nr:pyridoxamine 5'-phosphate oxidase family protein [Microlunatus endophyticus]
MPLSIHEREQFLAEPIWYDYEPGGVAWVLSRPESRKAKLISEAGRFTLLVRRATPTTRYVSIEGPVIDFGPSTEDEVRRMARRYLPRDAVEPYVDFARREHRIRMRPEHWLSSDLG